MEAELFIDEDGQISCVYQDSLGTALKEIGSVLNKRACFVEPFFADPSKWAVDVTPILNVHSPRSGSYIGSGLIGVFDTRAEALVVEAEWLNRYLTTRHWCVWNGATRQFE